jgi:hypothetical protein
VGVVIERTLQAGLISREDADREEGGVGRVVDTDGGAGDTALRKKRSVHKGKKEVGKADERASERSSKASRRRPKRSP